jgi:hypothetical protein
MAQGYDFFGNVINYLLNSSTCVKVNEIKFAGMGITVFSTIHLSLQDAIEK